MTGMHLRMVLPLLALAGLLLGCRASGSGAGSGDASDPADSGGTSSAAAGSGLPQADKARADALAKHVLPALVDDLGVQLRAGAAAFVECDYNGWRYQADGDLAGGSSGSAQAGNQAGTEAGTDAVRGVLAEQPGLQVEVRDDGSVLGRDGDLTILIGAPLGPPTRSFRHYMITHACTPYSSDAEDYLRSTASTDYSAYVPASARYVG